jgi:hypothetical protein
MRQSALLFSRGAMSTKVQFVLSDEALEVINRSATERKRGEWISQAVLEYSRIMGAIPGDTADSAGLLERIENRLARIEKQLAVITRMEK